VGPYDCNNIGSSSADLGKLATLQAPVGIDGSFASVLFSGTQPTTADFGESAAFRHYLHCLRQQVHAAKKSTFQETAQGHETLLSVAEAGLGTATREISRLCAIAGLGAARDAWLRRIWA
jgi:hypothetical protein